MSIQLVTPEIVLIGLFLILTLGLWIWSLIAIHSLFGNWWVTGLLALFSSVFLQEFFLNGAAAIAVLVLGIIGAFKQGGVNGVSLLLLQLFKIILLLTFLASVLTRMEPYWNISTFIL